jgi:hypothetical protein
MLSPFKLAPMESNYLCVNENQDLAKRLATVLNDPVNSGWWQLRTGRQRTNKYLHDTESIFIRYIDLNAGQTKPVTDKEWNDFLPATNTPEYNFHPIFQELEEWFRTSLMAKGVSNIDLGRVFFSRLFAGACVKSHVDSGKYYDTNDRFQFIIDCDKSSSVKIREESIELELGKLYWINNHVLHSITNESTIDRIICIFDAKLE